MVFVQELHYSVHIIDDGLKPVFDLWKVLFNPQDYYLWKEFVFLRQQCQYLFLGLQVKGLLETKHDKVE